MDLRTRVYVVDYLKQEIFSNAIIMRFQPARLYMHVANRSLPSSKNPHFENEARYTTFLVKMSFVYMRMKLVISVSKAQHLPSF